MLGPDHKPLANAHYVLEVEGITTEGTLDGSGVVTAQVPDGAASGRCTVWTGAFPEGSRTTFQVEFAPLDAPSSILGAQARLRNIGLYAGRLTGVLDLPTPDALLLFQHAHELKATGELDGPTVAKLSSVHP
ncbi:MAG: peptidoglycan-binding protein [Myxococcota bacterium]|nr:peptidoglycan-binding protein [Myxococcota bacterium]